MQSIKIVVVGDDRVGKTSYLICYTTGSFPEEYIPTVFDNYSPGVMVDNRSINLGLWDTAGAEIYARLRPLSYPMTDCFMIMYSVASIDSFNNIKSKWVPEISSHCRSCPFVIVGNKCDLRDDRETIHQLVQQQQKPITTKQGIELAMELGASAYFECSGLFKSGVPEVCETKRVSQPTTTTMIKVKKGNHILNRF
eukprot:TRINITY_DN4423_c0_g1_i1.p1 TRINITY_DN4423_c0_g1~~TRINITY_DN4423_c0_g1_i1.p1  ORF type:complete len:196 (-),score=34.54 TRINITY_DN4423_c0_g1_i1:262-849(-)